MKDAWDIASDNFNHDDGSLPDVEFSGLKATSVHALFEFFRSQGSIVTKDATVYDNVRELDIPISEVNDPAGMVTQGKISSFCVCFGGMTVGGIPLPEIGTYVFQDSVEFSIRMGSDWNRKNVDAFFRLLVQLKRMAPESVIQSSENEGFPYPDKFIAALTQYLAMPDGSQDTLN